MSKLVSKLLYRNLSKTQLAAFVLSNFIGLAIIIAGVQFYSDVRSLWNSDDSVVRRDYLVVNRKVSTGSALSGSNGNFTEEDVRTLESQPWVRKVGRFRTTDYKVSARVSSGGRGMSTYLFFESIPDEFIDVDASGWKFNPSTGSVPIIISKDYLTLYNFGFASSAGLPRLSEQMIGAVPLDLTLISEDGSRSENLQGRIIGFSNRLNTILVPEEFMEWSNSILGDSDSKSSDSASSRLIIDVNSPGDAAISTYLDENNMELSGDKSSSEAVFLLNAVAGVIIIVGLTITILSLFVLLLSVALLMQKNREKLHTLILLGYPMRTIAAPYERLVVAVSLLALCGGIAGMLFLRSVYLPAFSGPDGENAGILPAILAGVILCSCIILFGIVSVRSKVKAAFTR